MSTNKELEELAQKIRSGLDYESLCDDLDLILGTKLEDRDLEAEEAWENNK